MTTNGQPIYKAFNGMRLANKECEESRFVGYPRAVEGKSRIQVPVFGLGFIATYPFDHDDAVLLVPAHLFSYHEESLYYFVRTPTGWADAPVDEGLRIRIEMGEIMDVMKHWG